jgi:hypothetical protein
VLVEALDDVEEVLGVAVDGAAGVVGVGDAAPSLEVLPSLEDVLSLEDAVDSLFALAALDPLESVL